VGEAMARFSEATLLYKLHRAFSCSLASNFDQPLYLAVEPLGVLFQ